MMKYILGFIFIIISGVAFYAITYHEDNTSQIEIKKIQEKPKIIDKKKYQNIDKKMKKKEKIVSSISQNTQNVDMRNIDYYKEENMSLTQKDDRYYPSKERTVEMTVEDMERNEKEIVSEFLNRQEEEVDYEAEDITLKKLNH